MKSAKDHANRVNWSIGVASSCAFEAGVEAKKNLVRRKTPSYFVFVMPSWVLLFLPVLGIFYAGLGLNGDPPVGHTPTNH